MTGDVASEMDSQRCDLGFRSLPHARMLSGHRLDSIPLTGPDDTLLKQTDVVSRRQTMRFEIDDGICDELAGSVKCGLSATHCFEEFCISIVTEEFLLLCAYGADFTPTAGIYRIELGGYYGWTRGGDGGGTRFVGEEALYEGVLYL